MRERTHRRRLLLSGTALLALLGWTTALAAPPPVEELRQILHDPSHDSALRETRLRRCLPTLLNLDDLRAALALSEWKDTDADEQRAVVDRAVRKLLAQRFEQAARQTLWHGDAAVRRAVVDMLGDMGVAVRGVQGSSSLASALAPDLVQLVEQGPPILRAPAARALGLMNPDVAVAAPALQHLLETGDDAERTVAAGAIRQWLEQTSQLAQHRPNLGGATATEAEWARLSSTMLPAIGHGLRDQRADVRRLCAGVIAQTAHTLDDLVPDLASTGPGQRRRGNSFAVDLRPVVSALREQALGLTQALGDKDSEVRVQVRLALRDMATAQARWLSVAERAPASSEGSGGSRLQPVTYHPDQSGTAESLPGGLQGTLHALARGVEDRDVAVRRATLDALEALGSSAAPALPAVVKALSDSDRFVRWTAARTLGKIAPLGAERAVPALAHLLKDDDLDLRLTALAALERYGPAAAAVVPSLLEHLVALDAEERVAVLGVLGAVGLGARTAVPPVIAFLRDPDPRVRRAAAQGLGVLGHRSETAVDALLRALDDSDPEVRQAANEALVRIRRE